MPSALVLLAPGFEEIEAITIIDILRRGAIDVTTAGLEKDLIKGSHDISVLADRYYGEVDAEDFDMLILPGGQPGTNNLKNDPVVIKWIKRRFESSGKMAAICAAPTVFYEAGVTGNLKLTSYPSEEKVFVNSVYRKENVVEDKNFITGRGVGIAIEFALKIVAVLKGEKAAEEVGKQILFR